MFDFGFEKLAMIGAVALIVIGPEKLPRVARTVGTLLGKAQRYVADVKAEVNRSIELDDLKKMKTQFEDAARDVHQSVSTEMSKAHSDMTSWRDDLNGLGTGALEMPANSGQHEGWVPPPPSYSHPKKNWRLKRAAVPGWYKQKNGIRAKAQSGAARVARFRPPRTTA